jgi:FtsZ-interacting cell division protein ZipA
MLDGRPVYRSGETVLNRSSRGIRITVILAAAIMVAGCADSRMAANNASSGAQASGEAPYHTAYGISSDGPTTDLYTELFGSSRRDNGNAATPPTTQQAQPVTAAAPPQQVQPATASATNRQGQRTTASAANRQVQPAPAPTTQVAQQPPAAPQPPPEPDTPTAYGISSNGPTTDLYTELFGPRRRDGQ